MLDKIVILSCKKQAYMIFTDRAPFSVRSDIDITPLLMWFLDFPNVHLALNIISGPFIEVRRACGDEITLKIDDEEAA